MDWFHLGVGLAAIAVMICPGCSCDDDDSDGDDDDDVADDDNNDNDDDNDIVNDDDDDDDDDNDDDDDDTYVNGDWRVTEIYRGGYERIDPRIGIDLEGQIHITYMGAGYEPYHSFLREGVWMAEPVRVGDRTFDLADGPDLVMDESGYFGLAVCDVTGPALTDRHVALLTGSTGEWHVEEPDATCFGTTHVALTLDGQPAIAFRENSESGISLAQKKSDGWNVRVIIDRPQLADPVEFVVDGEGHGAVLLVARNNWDGCDLFWGAGVLGGDWDTVRLERTGYFDLIAGVAMAVDGAGIYHIPYSLDTYAPRDPFDPLWLIEGDGVFGDPEMVAERAYAVAVAVDGGGRTNIVYSFNTGGDGAEQLRHLVGSEGTWGESVIDDRFEVFIPQIATDEAGYAHVAYSAIIPPGRGLFYATNRPAD